MTTLYFIGILTPPNIDDTVLEWKKYMQRHFNCKVALRSPAHITLIPPFNAGISQEKNLTTLLKTFHSFQAVLFLPVLRAILTLIL